MNNLIFPAPHGIQMHIHLCIIKKWYLRGYCNEVLEFCLGQTTSHSLEVVLEAEYRAQLQHSTLELIATSAQVNIFQLKELEVENSR